MTRTTNRLGRFRAGAGLVAALFALACSGDVSPTRVLAPPPPQSPQSAVQCSVTLIADGDTFDCAGVGRVRFIGIDAPEMGQTPFGAQARAELTRLMPIGTVVRLERDVSEKDVYGRHLAYVWQDMVFMNELLVKRGYALSAKYPPDTAMIPRLRDAEDFARESIAGLWQTGGFNCPPREYREGRC
jgi:micrococcal nuclease